MPKTYYVYFTTNTAKKVLYIGVTNDLLQRILEHYLKRGNQKSFAGKFYCYNLVYYEEFKYVNDAISREKEIKSWTREKKNKLIESVNPKWAFYNFELFGCWPPHKRDQFHREDFC